MVVYYFLALVACWIGIKSLMGGFRFAAYVRRETARPVPDFQPFVSVIAPCRGLEPGLAENLRPLLEQDYPRYEVLFVFDRADDPAAGLVSHGFSHMAERSSLVRQQTAGRRFTISESQRHRLIRNRKYLSLLTRMRVQRLTGSASWSRRSRMRRWVLRLVIAGSFRKKVE
jgi:hypothetical protein